MCLWSWASARRAQLRCSFHPPSDTAQADQIPLSRGCETAKASACSGLTDEEHPLEMRFLVSFGHLALLNSPSPLLFPGKSGWPCGQLEEFPGQYKGEERKEKQDLPETSQSKNGAARMIRAALPKCGSSVPSLLLRTHWHLE